MSDLARKNLEEWNAKQERRVKAMQVVLIFWFCITLAWASYSVGKTMGEGEALSRPCAAMCSVPESIQP